MTTTAAPVLGKRKEPPLPSPTPPSSTTKNIVVDAAFQRLFGYSWGTSFDLPKRIWGTTFDLPTPNKDSSKASSKEQEMIEIFGPARTARILNLPWDVVAPASATSSSSADYYNPAAILTTKIVASDTTTSTTLASSSAAIALQTNSVAKGSKKRRLEDIDFKSIALPKHMVSSASSTSATSQTQASTSASLVTAKTTVAPATSKLDSVLSQISGKKQLNTVEKTSNDWEGFKETDKTLQDELERNAQSKNAYLVKQDFLNRVDHRKFELEKEERDRERSRR
eukprot:CAMPEP_0116120626 /NCGR_PEP_ID=MMETSP0329-20121206/3274_1 /TAXON_ID=697910 /ORGANISM="Pseudo-nitzschia arenysensis, Strain B593" /LENGTH=281 /DNA_ID=CAMNT_0003614405 /DNA_START=110 /DNA_END=952 /DNA_ORIENTATION=-